jgi:CRP/FNR family transcriptional regulator, dissimilatory nitrate respiration regulator
MDLTFLLKSCKLFADLERNELDAIQQISTRRECRKTQIIFSEGEPSRGFFVVATGAVRIFRHSPDGRERVLHVVDAGDSFAEAAMFMEAYPATAEALVTSTTVIQIDKNGFKQLITRDPKLSFKIIGSLVKWLREMRDALTDLTMKEVPARFASYVLSLRAEPGKPITVNFSKSTVAQMLGTTKETLSRLLHRLAQHRVLTYKGKQIKILNRARLEKIASGEQRI